MASKLTLHPTAAAAAQALSAGEGGALVAGDSSRGFFAFAIEMARKVRPFRLPDPAERLALAWAASQRAKLGLPVSAARGFARALSEIHGSGLTSGQLRNLDNPGLAAALEAHQQLLSKRELCDPASVPWLAAEAAAAHAVADSIEVAPRITWNQGELSWMEALGRKCQITVRLPEDADRPELFEPLDAVHQDLARSGTVRLAAARLQASGTPFSSAEAHSFGSAADEARRVAVRVRSLLRSGISPDSIAVTSLGDPGPEVSAALQAVGIPVGQDRRMLTATLAGQIPLLVLAAAEEGVPRERLCELLEARQLTLRNPLHWARRLREAGSGTHASQRLFPPLRALLDRKPKDSHDASRDGLTALEGAVDRIAALSPEGTIADQARSLWRALGDMGILQRLTRRAAGKVQTQLRQLSLFVAVEPEARSFEAPWVEVGGAEGAMAFKGVSETFDSLVRLDLGGRSITIAEFATLLRGALSATAAPAVPALTGGVALAPVEALLGRRFSHVFITGLAGDGPPASEDSFLPESLRRSAVELTDRPATLPLAGPVSSRRKERMIFALAADLAEDWLWASGARTKQGKQLEPSPLLAEVGKVASGGIQNHPLQPWPAGGQEPLSRAEVCATWPDEPAVVAAEPRPALVHQGLLRQRVARERAILERRIHIFSGDLTAPDLQEPLATRLAFDAAHPLSASSLDRLAGCGFRALADVVLRLKEPEEQDEALDARHKGTLLHACLERAFRALKVANLLPLRGGARDGEERGVFLAAIRKEFADREAAGEIGHPVVWGGARSGMERVLLRVLEAEQRSDTGFVPEAFEVKFGNDPDSQRPSQPLSVDGREIQLGGRADRIDRGSGGSLRVVDYKTGGALDHRNRRLEREFAGRDLQLGHYDLILKLAQPEVPVDGIYYSIYQAKDSRSLAEVCQSAGVALEEFLDGGAEGRARAVESGKPNLPNLIESHQRRARGGQFAVQPGDCGYCQFAAGCRVGGLIEEWE